MFNKAVKWDMLERSPFDRGEDLFYKNTLKRERALTEDEVKRLIEACPPYLKPIVATAVYTGLRKANVLFLKWKDVYLATQERKGNGDEFIAIYPAEGDWKKT